MRRILICMILIFCMAFDVLASHAQTDPASEVIQRVNALRASYGVPAYQVDSALMAAAQAQTDWSAANNHIGHDGPGGNSPNDRAQAAGYGNGKKSFALENAAHGTMPQNTPELVVRMWQSDWVHLDAMISENYEHIGVGYTEANGHSWFVMMVGYVGAKGSSGGSQSQNVSAGEVATNPPVVSQPIYVPFTRSEPDESGAIYHEVQPGQSAWTIAAQYGIELNELFELNNLTEDSVLYPGDRIMIRPPDQPAVTPTLQPLTETSIDLNPEVALAAITPPAPTQETVEKTSSKSKSIPLIIGLVMVLSASLVLLFRTLRK